MAKANGFKSYQVKLAQNKVTKNTVRFATSDENAAVSCIYISKKLLGTKPPANVTVQVQPA